MFEHWMMSVIENLPYIYSKKTYSEATPAEASGEISGGFLMWRSGNEEL